jgi:hypothetical protein
LDSGLLQRPHTLQVAVWCLLKAAWKPTKYATRWGVIDLLPGQLIASRSMLCRELALTDREARTAVNLLRKMEFMTSETSSDLTRITIVKWEEYQGTDQQTSSETSNRRPALVQHPSKEEEGKKVRKKEQATWESDEAFKSFWQAWPRSSRKGSPVEAYKAWIKASPPIDKVLETLAWKKKSEDWAIRPDGKDFIKMPSTWLNNAGWLEENPAAHKNDFRPRKTEQVF